MLYWCNVYACIVQNILQAEKIPSEHLFFFAEMALAKVAAP